MVAEISWSKNVVFSKRKSATNGGRNNLVENLRYIWRNAKTSLNESFISK
jgi:hypothetical protein